MPFAGYLCGKGELRFPGSSPWGRSAPWSSSSRSTPSAAAPAASGCGASPSATAPGSRWRRLISSAPRAGSRATGGRRSSSAASCRPALADLDPRRHDADGAPALPALLRPRRRALEHAPRGGGWGLGQRYGTVDAWLSPVRLRGARRPRRALRAPRGAAPPRGAAMTARRTLARLAHRAEAAARLARWGLAMLAPRHAPSEPGARQPEVRAGLRRRGADPRRRGGGRLGARRAAAAAVLSRRSASASRRPATRGASPS